MKKIKYTFLLAIVVLMTAVFFTGCLKSDNQITGPQGKTGATGSKGASFITLHTLLELNSNTFQGSGPIYVCKWGFAQYDSSITYALYASAAKVDAAGKTPVWFQLPYVNVYETGDIISASIKKDTVTVEYTTSSGWPDSTVSVQCNIIVTPLPQPN